jgi:ATP-dependent DNA helicase RecQ
MRPDPVAVLRRTFGYPSFRPGQEDLVRAVLDGRDALGILPTGGGKSLCYQVPAKILPGLTLVVTPLISLMQDQVARARAVGLAAESMSAAQSTEERGNVLRRVLRAELDLLFVSPERLETPRFRELTSRVGIALIAVDEAHCISEWGHDFRPAYRTIADALSRVRCPTLALTASATPEVRKDIRKNLRLRMPVEVVRSFDRPNLRWAVMRVGSVGSRARQVYHLLRHTTGSVIVYAPTRRSVEEVRDVLAARGVRCDAYHAGLLGAERARVQERFMQSRVRTVVATNAFGMGIDKPDVRVVVHVQLPATLEAYYQEAGRAGRDGLESRCIALHGRGDRRLADGFLDSAQPPVIRLRRMHRALWKLAAGGGTLRADDPRVVRALGGVPHRWINGEPHGPLAALERAGAIQADGTEHGAVGSIKRSFEVVRHINLSGLRARRRAVRAKIRAVEAYARTRACRSRALLHYFGEEGPAACGRCDRCGWDWTAALQDADA